MKKRVLSIIICLTVFGVSYAQKIVEDNFQRLQVAFTVGDVKMSKTEVVGQPFTMLSVEGMMSSAQVGAPNLPTWSSIIEVPLCDGYEVEVRGTEYDTIRVDNGLRIAPVQPSRSKSDTSPIKLSIDETVYSTDAFFAAAPLAMVENVGIARDRKLARLQFSPVSYNPVQGLLVVCRKAEVTVLYKGADAEGSMKMYERYFSPMFGAGLSTFNTLYSTQAGGAKAINTSAPIRMLIVAHSMFRGQLDDFVAWKRRKGFITDIVYTDDAGVGTTNTAIAAYVKSQYTNATTDNPAPTYLIIVGDHDQIPAFSAQVTSPSSDHITDLYYVSWTSGDHIPDCYCGRFSAQNRSQLIPQIQKTLMYEQYTFADPSFLDRAVMVAGVDGGSSGDNGYTYGDPAMDYAITNYVNGAHGFSQVMYFKNNTSIVPTGANVTVGSSASSNSATVRNYYNQGAGWINYSAHGSATSWGTPNFTTDHAAAMTNTQKFGIMIGNCCLTNKFETSTCLGESVLRKGDYCGAVGYIGGSNSTYWGEDFYWAVGVRSSIGPSMSMAYNSSNLGGYDRIFHTHSEAYSAWVKTQGELVFQGNMAVESSSSSLKYYYWEIYHLMGDPSLMPYLTQASQMSLNVASSCPTGTTSLTVSGAAPYAYVAVTNTTDRTLMGAGFANASGSVTLTLSPMTVGTYEVVATASQYQPAYSDLTVTPPDGPYLQIVSMEPQAEFANGATVQVKVKVKNVGTSAAQNVSVALTCDDPMLTLSTNTLTINSLSAGSTVTRNFNATVSLVANGTEATIGAEASWNGSTTTVGRSITVTVGEPYGENFEEGEFVLDWEQGTYPWEITSENATEGTYCARSCSTLNHSQTSEMTISFDAYQTENISFYYRVSSESNYDKFHFYLDGVEEILASGAGEWTYASYDVTAGTHILKFTYSKDQSVSSNSDCAWIDDLRLPRPMPDVTITVSAANGTTTGSGTYRMGTTAQIGVYTQAGYRFVRWNDNNTDNPRDVVAASDVTYQAVMQLGGGTVEVDDTTYINVPVPVEVHDTTYVNVPVTVEVHDTSYVNVIVPLTIEVHDTSYIEVEVPVTVEVHDTVWLFDTITLYDTVYLTQQGVDGVEAMSVKVYSSQGQVVVEGADGQMVMLYDVAGRLLATKRDDYVTLRFDVPIAGAYLLKVGDHPARRVVVMK